MIIAIKTNFLNIFGWFKIEFLYYGVADGEDLVKSIVKQPTSLLVDEKSVSACAEFVDSAKDRLKYLEMENDRVENAFRDYQHKIKSKYYPINDDPDIELRVVPTKRGTYDPTDVDKFIESTLRASAKARQIREEIADEVEKSKAAKSRETSLVQTAANLRAVDEMIQNVPLVVKSSSIRDDDEEDESLGKRPTDLSLPK